MSSQDGGAVIRSEGPHPDLGAHLWDALVVGAGPAGSMVARELALGGATVLLVDRKAFPRWKVCGCCLSAGTLSVLEEAGLGQVPSELGAVPLHSVRIAGWSTGAEIPLLGSFAVSRSSLDEALVGAAVTAGVTFVAPARARPAGLEPDARAVHLDVDGARKTIRARVVIAADGLGSGFLSSASEVGASPSVADDARIGLGAVFGSTVPEYCSGVVHMAVGDAGYVGLVRLEGGTLDVAAALDPRRLGEGRRPEGLVNEILAGAGWHLLPPDPLEGWSGTPLLTRSRTVLGDERLFAVGDAAGYVEPFTGEGMAWALSGARGLAPIAREGIRSWDPGLVPAWDRAYRRTVGRSSGLIRGVAWGLRHPGISRAGLRLLRVAPSLAAPFVRRAARAPTTGARRVS